MTNAIFLPISIHAGEFSHKVKKKPAKKFENKIEITYFLKFVSAKTLISMKNR